MKLYEVQREHASWKQPQKVGVVERSHGARKRILKTITNEPGKDKRKYVQLVNLIHNTSCLSAIRFRLTFFFHGCEPLKH